MLICFQASASVDFRLIQLDVDPGGNSYWVLLPPAAMLSCCCAALVMLPLSCPLVPSLHPLHFFHTFFAKSLEDPASPCLTDEKRDFLDSCNNE